jgi:hypothetical protein
MWWLTQPAWDCRRLYLDKIQQRRAVLGLPATSAARTAPKAMDVDEAAVQAEDVSDDEDEDSNESDDEAEGRGGVDLDALPEEGASKPAGSGASAGVDRFLEGEVPREVYKAAVDHFPDDTPYHIELIRIISLFDRMERLVDDAYAELGDSAAAVAARCIRPAQTLLDDHTSAASPIVDTVASNFVDALVGSEGEYRTELGEAFAEFVLTALADRASTAIARVLPVGTIRHVCELLHSGADAGEQISALWCRITAATPELTPAARAKVYESVTRSLAGRGLSAATADAAARWAAEVASVDPEASNAVYRTGVELVTIDADQVWLLGHKLDLCIGRRDAEATNLAFDDVVRAAAAAAWAHRADPQHELTLCSLLVRRVHWSWAIGGVDAARTVYSGFLRTSPFQLGWAFIGAVVDFEVEQPEIDVARVRALLEKALAVDGEVMPAPWLRFLELEASMGEVGRLGPLYDRAIRTLQDPVQFITEARLRQIEQST